MKHYVFLTFAALGLTQQTAPMQRTAFTNFFNTAKQYTKNASELWINNAAQQSNRSQNLPHYTQMSIFNNSLRQNIFSNNIHRNSPIFGAIVAQASRQSNDSFNNNYGIYGLAAGIAGYGLLNSQQPLLADEQQWDDLSQERKAQLIQEYADKFKNSSEKGFEVPENLTNSQKTAIVHAYVECLTQKEYTDPIHEVYPKFYKELKKQNQQLAHVLANYMNQGKEIRYLLDDIYRRADKRGKEALFSAIINSLKKGIKIWDLHWIYQESNAQQKDLLFAATIDYLEQDEEIDEYTLQWMYAFCNTKHKDLLIPIVVNYLKQEKEIVELYCFYEKSNDPQKDLLIPIIIDHLKHDEDENVKYLKLIYQESNIQQKDLLLPIVVDYLKQIKKVNKLHSFYKNSNAPQKDLLIPTIIDHLKHDKNIKLLMLIYQESNTQQKNLLIPIIFNDLKLDEHINELYWFYKNSNDPQKDLLIPTVIDRLKHDKNIKLLKLIYQESNTQQKNLLIPIIFNDLKLDERIDELYWFYKNSNDPQKDLLIPTVIDRLKQAKDVTRLHLFYEESNDSQKDQLIPIIIDSLKQGRDVTHLYWIYEESNDSQKDRLISIIIDSLKQGKDVTHLGLIYEKSNDTHKDQLISAIIDLFPNDLRSFAETQTTGHINENIFTIYEAFGKHLKDDSPTGQTFRNAIESEITYNKNNYHVFYHSQIWDIYWWETLYTKLWSLKHKMDAQDYLFTRFEKDSTCTENAHFIAKSRDSRKQIRDKGRQTDGDRQKLLFMNYALFGNSTNLGSCSADYFLNNSNISKPDITSNDIFSKFDLGAMHAKYKNELKEIEKEFLALTEYGNLIQIAVPEKHVQKHLYLTTSGGPKRKARIEQDTGEIKKTDDVIELLETLKTSPDKIQDSDRKEFVWIVTADTIQKAMADGVEIKSFNTANPERLAAVMQKLDNLLERIAQDDARSAQPKLVSEGTPWDCYKKHKQEFNKQRSK